MPKDDRGEKASPSLEALLNQVLLAMHDRKWRKRPLANVYVDSLIDLLWKKDFEPLASHPNPSLWGAPGGLKLQSSPVESWNVPAEAGSSKTSNKSGGPYSIIGAFDLRSPNQAKKLGKLKLKMAAGDGKAAISSFLVVFPYASLARGVLPSSPSFVERADGRRFVAQEPVMGNCENPVVVPAWDSVAGAVVWLVSAWDEGVNTLSLTAEYEEPRGWQWSMGGRGGRAEVYQQPGYACTGALYGPNDQLVFNFVISLDPERMGSLRLTTRSPLLDLSSYTSRSWEGAHEITGTGSVAGDTVVLTPAKGYVWTDAEGDNVEIPLERFGISGPIRIVHPK